MGSRAKKSRRQKRNDPSYDPRFADAYPNVVPFGSGKHRKESHEHPESAIVKPLECRGDHQKQYANAIRQYDMVFGLGPAGSGKTHVAVWMACQALAERTKKRIYIVRPVQGLEGEELGFIPGTIEQKFEPWIKPVRAIMDKYFGKGAVDCKIANEQIVICPLQYLSGMTLEDAFVIVDEAQNISVPNMKRTLTRLGDNSKMVLNGDIAQVDLRDNHGRPVESGLKRAMECLGPSGKFGVVEFTSADCQRHPLVIDVLNHWKD